MMEKKENEHQGVKENHKQRAYLNSITSVLDQISRQLIGFVVSPFLVKGLGNSIYGVYHVVLELAGYANMADTQSTQVLKWTLAKKRSVADEEELRTEITTGLFIIFLILPIILVTGSVVSWYAPEITNVPEQYTNLVRIACSVIILAIAVDKITNFFESILRGMNLGFKGMGIRTTLIILSGLSKIAIIHLGFGLIGLAILQVFIAVLTCFIFYILVKRSIPWFALGKTNKEKVLSYTKLSGWFMATKLTGMALFNTEKILLSYLVGPEYVTIYVLTLFSSSSLKSVLDSVISGIVPGVGSFFGKGEFEKIIFSHNLINNVVWLLSFGFGTSLLILNDGFLNLWMGPDKYAGDIENFLILLISIQYVFFFTTGNFINVTLNIKTKVFLTGLSAFISIGFILILVGYYKLGILGLCISLLTGRSILSFGFPYLLNKMINESNTYFRSEKIRPTIVAIGGFVLCIFLKRYFKIDSWLSLISYGVSISLFSFAIFWFLGFDSKQRKTLKDTFSRIKIMKTNDK